ncbi:MAG: helix-turn-helix domain-containing protein [Dehalococcoidia bacterium]
MTTTSEAPIRAVGGLLRDWRQRRRLSQLDLALGAEVSTRHLSFVETGRSTPSRELLLHLAEHLDVPLRERNALLLAAGYAPIYRETPLAAALMAPAREAIDKLLASHEPFPAVVVDRAWTLVSANSPAAAILSDGVASDLLTPPINALRLTLHPTGLAPRIVNLAEYSAHLLARLQREIAQSADPAMILLYDELRTYPGIGDGAASATEPAHLLYVPLCLRTRSGGELRFFSTVATFGTALDITLAELSIESFFPADAQTESALRAGMV